MNEAPRIRLEDIAARAGVSKMTVSLALRGEPRVSKATRRRIEALANELGYRPDPALSALNAYRRQQRPPRFAGALAYLNAFPDPVLSTPWRYYAAYFRGAKARAMQLGFSLEEFWLHAPGMNLRSLDRILAARGVSGLIVGPLPELHLELSLAWENYSAVALGFSLERPRLHTVAVNHFQSMVVCVERLVGLGYRRIGLYLERPQDDRVMRRWSGAYLTTRNALVSPAQHVTPVLYERFDPGHLQRWLRDEQPDAIVTGWPDLPAHLTSIGRRVPEDIGVAMPYFHAYHTAHRPELSCIDEHGELNGSSAVDLVAGMIYRNERGVPEKPLHILVQGDWHAGSTVRKVPAFTGKPRRR